VNRRAFLSACAGAAVASPMLAQAHDPSPNIIFILADDLGYGDLGCYGQKTLKTPNIDRLAAEGMRCTDVYSGSTVCAPSRCSLMTGMHMGHATVRGNRNPEVALKPDDVTVAEVVKQAGYTTAMFGKWGVGGPVTLGRPNLQGFDEFFGYLSQWHAHQHFPGHLWSNETEHFIGANLSGARQVFSHDLFTERALEFLDKNSERPFFLYLPYAVPHTNNELGNRTGDGMEVPDYGEFGANDWPTPEKGFARQVQYLDRDVGRILDKLKELKIDGNTVVFFSSDNGPGKIEAGSTSAEPWAFWDVLPTCAELAGVPPPEGIDGLSFVPALTGKPQKGHEYLYWEFHERRFAQAVRQGKWKAVRLNPGEPIELYDLEADLSETRDIAANHPEIVKRMDAIMRSGRTESPYFPVKES
jgi:arylsulfatase A-like enzyme